MAKTKSSSKSSNKPVKGKSPATTTTTNSTSFKQAHTCPTCSFKTKHLIILDKHIEHCPNAPVRQKRRVVRTYKCKKCKYKTSKPKTFLYHMRNNHGEGLNIFPCDYCEYASRYRSKLLRHSRLVHKVLIPIEADNKKNSKEVKMELPIDKPRPPSEHSNYPIDGIHEMEQDLDGDFDAENGDAGEQALSESENDPQNLKMSGLPMESPIKDSENAFNYICRLPNSPDSQMPAFQCMLCTYSNVQKWKVANHVRSFHMKKKVFKCPHCPFVTSRKIEYCIHKAQHSEKKVFSCKECDYSTESKSDYDHHVLMHENNPVIKCPYCFYTFDDEAGVQEHIAEYHPQKNQVKVVSLLTNFNKPEYTNNTYTSGHPLHSSPINDLKKLTNAAAAAASQEIACRVCGLKVKNESKLRIHMVSHSTEASHLCPLCTLRYKRSSDLNRHMKRKHGARLRDFFFMGQQEQPLNLALTKPPGMIIEDQPEEPSSTPSTSDDVVIVEDQPLDLSLPKEMLQVTENLKCSHCSYLAKWPSDLRRHLVVHSVEKRYKCPCCHRKYKYQFDLNMHLRRMHRIPAGRTKVSSSTNGPTTSEIMPYDASNIIDEAMPNQYESSPQHSAPEVTVSQPEIQRYKLTRQQVSPQGKYKCNYCPYLGKYQSEVDRHMRLHTGDKPYSCLFCTYRSHWRGDMKRHLQKHHSEEEGVAQDITNVMEKTYQPEKVDQSVYPEDQRDQLEDMDCDQASPSSQDQIDEALEDEDPYGAPIRDNASDQDGMEFLTLTPSSTSSMSSNSVTNKSSDKRPNVCPYCPFTCEAPSKLKCHMEIHENLKRFKCAHCGKRSNWTWDVRKHIKKEHPGSELHVIEMEEDEARETLPDYLQTHYKMIPKREIPDRNELPTQVPLNRITDQLPPLDMMGVLTPLQMANLSDQDDESVDDDPPSVPFSSFRNSKPGSLATKRCRPFKCSKCGRRSNWKWDMNKHIRNVHPQAKLIILTPDEAKSTMPKGGFKSPTGGKKENFVISPVVEIKKHEVFSSSPSKSKHNNQFDSNRTKKFKCSACPYRSDYRSDIGRHLKRLHSPGSASIIMLSEEDARATLQLYKERWVRGKFVFSPAKEKMYQEYDRQSGVATSSDASSEIHSPMTGKILSQVNNEMNYKRERDSMAVKSEEKMEVMDSVPTKSALIKSPASIERGKKWKCPKCSFTNANKKKVARHMRQHPKVKVFQCRICGEASDYRNSMYRHVRNKHNSTDYGSMVHESIAYVTTITKSEHEADIQNEDTPVTYRCKLCCQTSCWKSGIVRHIAETHKEKEANDFIEISQVCNVLPALPQQISNEMLADKMKNFHCDICPYKTSKSGLLKIHQAYHKPQRGHKYKCKLCPYYVNNPRLLHQHSLLHSEENNNNLSLRRKWISNQPLDNEEEFQENPLTIDMGAAMNVDGPPPPDLSPNNMTLSPPGRRYYCDQCPAVSRNKNDFMYHKQFHRPKSSSPFKCKLCNYWVSQRRLLRQHERVHLSEYIQHYHNNNNNGPKPDVLKTYADRNGAAPETVQASPAKSDASDYEDPVQLASIKHQLISSKLFGVPTTPDKTKSPSDKDSAGESMSNGTVLPFKSLRKIHQCRFCPYTNLRATVLRMHETMHGFKPGKPDLLKCTYCDYYVGNKGLLSHHMKVHSSSYQPGQDDMSDIEMQHANSEENLAQLNSSEDGDKKVSPTSPKVTDNGHHTIVHPGMSTDPLDLSSLRGNTFSPKRSERPIEQFMETASFKKWGCEKCPYATMKRAQFERHVSLHGSGQKYVCEFCDYSVPAYHLLLQHKKLHLEPNQNLLAAQSVSNLQRLPRIPADVAAINSYLSGGIDMSMQHGTSESSHLYENSTEFTEPKKVYKCDRCPYQNIRRDHLLSHLKFHMVQSELKCPYCDYSVSKQHLLVQHIKVHFSSPGFEHPNVPSAISTPGLDKVLHNINSIENKEEHNKKIHSPSPLALDVASSAKKELNVAATPKNTGKNPSQNVDGKCQYCERQFSSAAELQKHEEQHLVGNRD